LRLDKTLNETYAVVASVSCVDGGVVMSENPVRGIVSHLHELPVLSSGVVPLSD
jgi:hypothetical protein